MVALTLAPAPPAMVCQWAWVGYTSDVSFGRHVAARATPPVRPSLSSLPPGGQCPGDSVRPVRYLSASLPSSHRMDTETCPACRLLTPDRRDDTAKETNGNARHCEMVQLGEGLRLHPA